MTITPTSSAVNSGVVTGKVPSDGGMSFLRLRLPAIASGGMIMKNRPNSIARASVVLYQRVLTLMPPNAEPLLADADEYAYKISESPCGPGLKMLEVPNSGETDEIAVKARINSEKINTVSIAICTSKAWIFLPRYSGVRPTIRPAMKTDRMM